MAKAVDLKAAKERKQKKIVAVGGVLLVIVLFVQVPRTLKMMNGEAETAVAAAPSPSAPAPDGTPAPVPVPSDAAAPAPAPTVATASLVSFSRFASKDPFVQQVKEEEATVDDGSAGGAPAAPPGELAIEGSDPEGGKSTADPVEKTSAEIEVNGVAELISVGTPFPVATPMFLLTSVSAKSVAIKVADGGSFASGAGTLTLTRGKPVTLVNTADGTRFVLLLKAVS